MDTQEVKLEEVSRKVDEVIARKHVPTFEVYATVFSIITAISLFWFPQMLDSTKILGGTSINVYWAFLYVMPQWAWAITFFVAGITKALGLLVKKDRMRILGLVLSVVIYLCFTVCYVISFPAIGMVVFFCMTMFTIISIPLVKHTGLN